MKLEEDMILAKPGYNEKYKDNVTWEQLKNSFTLYKRIPMIVAGGSHSGPIDPNEAVGFVDAKIDEENQIIRGEPVFYDEKFESVPAEIQRRLLYKEFVPASLGYQLFKDLRKVDHIAIGVESPVFKDIGFHAEDKFRYEETEGINKQEQQPKSEESISKLKAEDSPKPLVTFTQEQFDQLLESIRGLIPAPPQVVEETIEEVERLEEPPAEATIPQPKPEIEPERVIPRDTGGGTDARDGGWYTDPTTGRRVLSWRIAGEEQQKK
jgi:hypothetical protein